MPRPSFLRFVRYLAALLVALAAPAGARAQAATAPAALRLGDTFLLTSGTLGESRRINVYQPPGYPDSARTPLPVLYMPDGGLGEDFLHVAGLVQILVDDGLMRPFLLVGIENTARRRDLTGPTRSADDRKIAPQVGGSAAFRQFIRRELMPTIRQRYATTAETALVGESLAGLFVVETLLLEPDLFDTYLALDPSLWWNQEYLLGQAEATLRTYHGPAKTLYVAASSEPELAAEAARLAASLGRSAPAALRWHYQPFPLETHRTIYHPAALAGFRQVFKPQPAAPAH